MSIRVRRRAAAVVASLAAASLAALTAAPPVSATSSPAQIATSKSTGATYLKSLQAADGSFVTGGGLSNEWAFSALAAAGTAAVDVMPGGDPTKNARGVYRTYLSSPTWPSASPVVTDFERAALNAYAAGIDPARVSATRNLVADIASYWLPSDPGYYGNAANFNGTVFALLALGGTKTQSGGQRAPQKLIDASVTAVRANQHTDGGWTYQKVAGNPTDLAKPSDIDMTGAALAALCTGGVANTDPAVVGGKNFLKSKLVNASGAFNAMFGVNTNSNAWAVAGLNACGINPQNADFTTAAGKTPIDFLIAQQFKPGGGFKYLPSDTAPNAYASIDGVRAVSGAGFAAAPPTPVTSGAPTWVATTAFTSGSAAKLALVVDDGSATPKVCAVTVTPTGTTTTLGDVLDAAATATPAGCVTAVVPASGSGPVTSVNGVANSGSSTWKVSLDGGTPVAATRGTAVSVGDTVSLRYGV